MGWMEVLVLHGEGLLCSFLAERHFKKYLDHSCATLIENKL